jgi:sarcosine oxidase subunit alpha
MNVASIPISRSPLHHWHATHGARFTDAHGWQVPASYSSVERETDAVRAAVGLADISAFSRFSVMGPVRGLELAAKPHDVAAIDAGGPALACRLRADQLLALASTSNPTLIRNRLAQVFQPRVLTDVTSTFAGFCLVGPAILEVLRRLTPLDVSSIAFPQGSCAETSLAGVQAVLVKPPASPQSTVRVYVAWDVGEYVWERLVASGSRLGLVVIGMEAMARLSL